MTPAASDDHPVHLTPDREPAGRERAEPERARRSSRRVSPRLTAMPLALGCLLLAVYLGVAQRDAAKVDEANRLGVEGRFADAERAARSASRPPARDRGRLVVAYALRDQGRLAEASRAFAAAARADPNNWALHRDHAVVLLRLGDRRQARRTMTRALELNPRMRLPPPFERASAAG